MSKLHILINTLAEAGLHPGRTVRESLKSAAGDIPMPDLLLCASNICHTVIKWYENLAKRFNIPVVMIDMPFNHTDEVHPNNIKYMRNQLLEAIRQLERISGKKFDHDRFREVMRISNETSSWWFKACSLGKHTPSPLNGFDMFNYMAVIVCMRGNPAGRDMFRLWYEELAEKVRNGSGPWKDAEEKYRVIWDGIACWPHLGDSYKVLRKNGVNMVTSTYPASWNIIYEGDDLDGMARAYSGNVFANRNLEHGARNLAALVRDYSIDGIVYHSNRSCKLMDFRQYEIQRRVERKTGVPSVIFDGDQTDPRAFSLAQYETRIQALVEMMEANKAKRRAEA
jgi:benzoyl-CoA reductase/2-hydroxyglutaryl-CoA dehydratase subunit BcrC/BadD/HgdB